MAASERPLSDLMSNPHPRYQQVRKRVASRVPGALLGICARCQRRLWILSQKKLILGVYQNPPGPRNACHASADANVHP
jgi:hypothetical protein